MGLILVVMGGPSQESSISLKSGQAVLNSLKKAGLPAMGLEITDGEPALFFKEKLKEIKPDICFLVLHGAFGEDGEAQKILTSLAIAYTGSGSEASLRAFNKLLTKEILIKNNIPTPAYYSLKNGAALTSQLRLPLVIKPTCQGSTIGVSVVRQKEQIPKALAEAFSYGDEALVEAYIPGREMTVGIMGDMALPVVEIKSNRFIFDYQAKYHDPETKYIVPAELPAKETGELKALGLRVHKALGLKDFSRVDIILGDDGQPYVLEANTIPGLSERSLFPKACQAAGISFEKMCLAILEMASASKQK
jgi:D-alanine-D-alanine ligase